MRIITEGAFSWLKCIELIFIWEFSSAVSPTSVGGSAVALVVLAQEKLSTAKTATIALLGPSIIRPGMTALSFTDGWGYTCLFAYTLMLSYGSLFFYGLLINPNSLKRLLVGFTKIKWLKRYRRQAIELGNNIIIASKEIVRHNWSFHLGAFLSTATARSCRFMLLN